MRLDRLVAALPEVRHCTVSGASLETVEIEAIAADSRQVRPGTLFVAYSGVETDGHAFLSQALAAGAAAVVGERDPRANAPRLPDFSAASVPYVCVPDGRRALASLHAAWHGYPARRLRMIGVTGTDGKTTTVNLIHAILSAAGRQASMVCTVSARIGAETYDTGLHTTTPDAADVQAYLARMVAAGSEFGVLEATSHGLAQHRVAACDFDVAVMTNITHEHLDFHGSPEAYTAAKAMLFEDLHRGYRKAGVPKVAILNRDDRSFELLRSIPADLQITYGFGEEADVRATEIQHGPESTRFIVRLRPPAGQEARAIELQTPLVGDFNVYNCLAAAAACLSQSLGPDEIRAGILAMRGVVGRMERVAEDQDFLAVVDFAHTPRALEVALQTIRRLTEGRVIVVFGSAGLRDRAKRDWMGRIAGQLADCVVITAEDPRTESVDDIMVEIARGCEAAGRREGQDYWRIADRAAAISFAVSLARTGDTVIVTGKGHEQSMCFGTTEYRWSDHEALRSALRGQPAPAAIRLPTASAVPMEG